MNISHRAYSNKIALRSYYAISTVLLLAYLVEFIKGSRSIGYTLFFMALCAVPVAIDIIVCKKNPESRALCFITGTGYGLLYLFSVFTTNSITTFTYAFPMFVVVPLFADIIYCAVFCGGAVLINLAYIVYHFVTIGYEASEIPDVEIRFLCTLLTGILVIVNTVATKRINDDKVRVINQNSEKVKSTLDILIETYDGMVSKITQVTGKMDVLGDSVAKIKDAMNEVATGSAETAESIQNQMLKTEEIQSHIVKVRDTADSIEKNMQQTSEKVAEGREQMDSLTTQVDKSKEANAQVIRQMKELTGYTMQMNTIIETISNIADSTVMLSLNASIEAARAGEAGRGFAVVASEISTLANQTMTATVNITDLINNINDELADVEEAVMVVTKSNEDNVRSTGAVKDYFKNISKRTDEVEDQTRELLEIVRNLEEANASIVEKIQNISAITEEVSAHTNETYNVSEDSKIVVDDTMSIVNDLNGDAEKLKNILDFS